MADNNTGTSQTQRSANARKASTRRSTGATKRSTAAKKAAQTRAQRSGSTARRRTTTAAKARANSAQRTATREARQTELTLQNVGERAALTYVGAALLARDNVVDTLDELRTKYGTRAKAERKLETQLRKAERRGETARRSLEREVKRTRTRVERELRERRGRFERQVRPLTRDARAESNLFSSQAEYITAQLENLVQSGRTAGTEFAERVQKRVASLV